MVSAFVLPATFSHHEAQGLASPPHGAALVDPQFLPTILTSPNSSFDGLFGTAVAASGSMYAVGAVHEEEASYDSPTHYGAVQLQDTANGATGTVWGPSVGGTSNQFGAALAMTSNDLVVGSPGARSDEGTAYVYSYSLGVQGGHGVVNTSEVAALTSPNAQSTSGGGQFGHSVAISGNLVVVGAPYENVSGQINAGHAYIFNLKTGSVIMLSSPAPEAGAYFGCSVAISGNRVLVGAPWQTARPDTPIGFAYVFAAPSGDLLSTLTPPTPTAGGEFGIAAALSGTVAVVGADIAGPGGPYHESGEVYEFNLATNASLTFLSPAPIRFGYFGFSVAVDASTVLIGAPGETSNGSVGAGNAYLFSSASGSLISSELMAPNWPASGFFGSSVAENGSDGVIVGAPFETGGGYTYGGHAYLFHQIPLRIASPDPLAPSGYAPGGLFGWSVAVDNGVTVVGAPDENGSADEAGAGSAYLLLSSTGPMVPLVPEYPQAGAQFGYAVAVWGKLVAVGAPDQTAGGAEDGAVYLYSAATGQLEAMLLSPQPSGSGLFGASVATNGSTVVVGAPGENHGAGYAYSFQRKVHILTTYWSPVGLNTTDPSSHQASGNGEFGFSVAINGSTVVVGAPGENSSSGDVTQAGNAYVFDAANGTLAFALTSPHPQSSAAPYFTWGFGHSVAVASGTIVVGAPGDSALGSAQAGHAYVFSETGGLPLHTLTSPNSVDSGLAFGWEVAVNAGIIGVTTPFEPAFGVAVAGNLYLFNAATGLLYERYNSPVPTTGLAFGDSISIGHGGVIVVGQPGLASNNALVYTGPYPGLAYQFFL